MTMRTVVAGLAAGVALLSGWGAGAAECKLQKLGDLTVDGKHGLPTVSIAINGKTGRLGIDTGAFTTFLTTEGAARLGVSGGDEVRGMRIVGPKGELSATTQVINNVVLGDRFQLDRMRVLILPQAAHDDVVGVLGLDVLAASDVEFALADDRISFFKADDCGKVPLAYWSKSFSTAETRRPTADRPHITTTVQLNGRALTATLSSGSAASSVDVFAAAAVGVKPGDPGVTPVSTDAAGKPDAWIGTFKTFAIGEEQINNVRLRFRDIFGFARLNNTGSHLTQKLDDLPSVVLGLDFLRSHRVMVANSQGKMYFTYNGGPVFAAPAK